MNPSGPHPDSVLVTGAEGFIGRRLVGRLGRLGVAVTAVVRRTAEPARTPHTGPGALDCPVVSADIGRPGWTAALPRSARAVVHLATPRPTGDPAVDRRTMTAVNVTGTAELLDWAVGAGADRFLFASTGNVCGPSVHPLDEGAARRPNDVYGRCKAAGEFVVATAPSGIDARSLRLYTPYGPGQQARLVPDLIDRVRTGTVVTLADGDGLVLSPTHIDDVIDVFAWALALESTPAQMPSGDVLTVAGPEHLSIRTMAETIGRHLGREARFEHVGGRASGLCGDGRRVWDAMGRSPRWSFADGIASLIDG